MTNMQKPKDRPILEAVLESAEVVADTIMRGDALAEIPFIGTAIKICRAGDSIRDQAFASKLLRFLSALDAVPEQMKERVKDKVSTSPEEAKKVGETLFFVLERVTDLDKPTLLAQLFVAYVDAVISADELRRLAQAVDASFADDLQALLKVAKPPEKSDEPWMQFLAHTGLTQVVAGETWDDIGHIYYQVTPLGNKLRNAYFHGRKKHG